MRPGDAEPSAPVPAALHTALSRAAALSRRWSAWPPASLEALEPTALARDLQLAGDTGRGHELARVALAEAGPALDPELRARLVAHARDAIPGMSFPPGTLGAALRSGALDGLEAREGAAALRVDWLALHLSEKSADASGALALTRTREGRCERVRGTCPSPSALALARRLAPDWRARSEAALHAALRASLSDEGGYHDAPESVFRGLMQALLPDAPGERAQWLVTRGLELLRPRPDAPVASASVGDATYTIHLLAADLEADYSGYGRVRVLARLMVYAGDELRDVHEGEYYEFPLDAADVDAPAPADESLARAAVDAWRPAMSDYLAQFIARGGGFIGLQDLLGPACPLGLICTWVSGGPPGPPPVEPARALLDPARLAAAAERVRRLAPADEAALRAGVDRQLLAAYAIDGWTALFCPWHRVEEGRFEEDRILLRPTGGEAAPILLSDPWNGHVMPVDGDAALFRVFAGFWREVIARAGLDLDLELPSIRDDDDDDDDADDDDRRTTLRAWLEFPLPSRGWPQFPAIDWRIYGDGREGDFIADFDFWDHGPFGMSPERRAAHRESIATHYHAFLREVIDPAFPRAPGHA